MGAADLQIEMPDIFKPSIEFLRRVISSDIQACTVKLIQIGANPSHIYRVKLDYKEDSSGPLSVIIKSMASHWLNDPYGPVREPAVYTEILANLALPTPDIYFVGRDVATGASILVMQDLEPQYYFPAPQHKWTMSELSCLLHAYAHLHAVGSSLVDKVKNAPWIYPPWHSILHKTDFPLIISDLVESHIWQPLQGIDYLIAATMSRVSHYAQCEPTLLHNDVYPPNVALPVDLDREAVLIDWGMATWGQAELDLAYLFMQPYRSASQVDRNTALTLYWDYRLSYGTTIPSVEERIYRQHHADAVLTLAMIPVAHRVARVPFPDGSAPQAYWRAMFDVLQEKLRALVIMEHQLHTFFVESTGEK